jgi:hypothetical protein
MRSKRLCRPCGRLAKGTEKSELLGRNLEAALGRWYRGPVRFIMDLRPGTVIKDNAMPVLLRQQQHATLLTVNEADFWCKVAIDAH